MKSMGLSLVALILLVAPGCEENSTDIKEERKQFLTEGIWEISQDTEVGQKGVQLRFYSDGRAQVRETASSDWYPDYLGWTISDNGEELTMTGTNGPGTMDQIKILELTRSICRGRIVNSTSTDAIGKTIKIIKI